MNVDIKLKVNGNPVQIEMVKQQFLWAGFRKAGFFTRRMLKKIPGNTGNILWIKNPTIQCFDDGNTKIVPMSTHPTDLEDICGTSAFIFLNSGRPCFGILQVFQSIRLATRFAYHFRIAAFRNFGNCRCSQPVLVPDGLDPIAYKDALICAWGDKSGYIVCGLDYHSRSCVIRWGYGAIPDYIENSLISSGNNIDNIFGFKTYSEKSLQDALAFFDPRKQ